MRTLFEQPGEGGLTVQFDDKVVPEYLSSEPIRVSIGTRTAFVNPDDVQALVTELLLHIGGYDKRSLLQQRGKFRAFVDGLARWRELPQEARTKFTKGIRALVGDEAYQKFYRGGLNPTDGRNDP